MEYARKDGEKTKKIAKKFVRYQEGAELYSIEFTKFQELAKEAKTVYKRICVYAGKHEMTVTEVAFLMRKSVDFKWMVL